jgi:hypothetical protein
MLVCDGCTYVDEETGVLERGLLADLLHDFSLCVGCHFGLIWWGFGLVEGALFVERLVVVRRDVVVSL